MRKREGKVYIDYGQNGHGQLLVAPFSVRPLPGAPVSAPLRWDEVGPDLRIENYTIRTLPERIQGMPADPLAGVLAVKPDLVQILGRLAERMNG